MAGLGGAYVISFLVNKGVAVYDGDASNRGFGTGEPADLGVPIGVIGVIGSASLGVKSRMALYIRKFWT
jgi:hypothetical protein